MLLPLFMAHHVLAPYCLILLHLLIVKKKVQTFAGKNMQVFHKHILPVDSDLQALLVCKVVFDHVFMPQTKKHSVTNIATAIGAAIEAECQMNYYDKEAPALLATLKKNYWHQARGTEYKRKCIQTLMHKQNISPWIHWDKLPKSRSEPS